MPDALRIYRESERNLDVAGNTIIALTLRVDPNRLRDAGFTSTMRVTALELLDGHHEFRAPGAVKFEASVDDAPPRCDLRANATLFYQVRRVRDGRSYLEGQQRVEYVSSQSETIPTTLVPAAEITRPTWRVFPDAEPSRAIWMRDVFGRRRPLEFTSYEQADAFAAWMNAHPRLVVGRADLALGKSGLRIWSGHLDRGGVTPMYGGPYVARLTTDDPSLGAPCARIVGRPTTVVRPVVPTRQ